ncbi:LpxD N-terminal domain-containing protein [Chloroflexota bacterium]
MKREITVRELIECIEGDCHTQGDLDRYVLIPSPIDEAGDYSLSFCANKYRDKAPQLIRDSKAAVIICPEEVELSKADYANKTLIRVPNPRLTFARLIQQFFVPPVEFDIHPSAIVDPKASIHPKVCIGPNCYVGECEIGEGTVLHSNIRVYPKTRIGKRVIIHPGAVIGLEGFGFERNENGQLESFPQIGRVIIEDDVQIGANVCIALGALGDTIIGAGTKIDNLTHISHNDRIGKCCQVNALVVICGSVTIGDYSQVAPHAVVREGVHIGHHVLVGMGSVVTKDIDDNLVVTGVPAKILRENF